MHNKSDIELLGSPQEEALDRPDLGLPKLRSTKVQFQSELTKCHLWIGVWSFCFAFQLKKALDKLFCPRTRKAFSGRLILFIAILNEVNKAKDDDLEKRKL